MGDRAYAPAAAKPVPVRVANGAGPPRPAPPSMAPGGGRVPPPPMYRPKPLQSRPPPRRRPRRSVRGWCCVCLLWLFLLLVGVALLCAIAAGAFYVVYRPRPPTFAVTSLRLAALNVSESDAVTSRVEFTVTARNPNEKIAFAYGDLAAAFSADGGAVGAGVVPGFVHPAGNTTVVRAEASATDATADPVQAAALRSRKTHAVSAQMDGAVGFQIGRFKSRRIAVRVTCAGISASLAKPEPEPDAAPAPAPVADAPAPARPRRGGGGGGRARGRSPPPRSSVVVRTEESSSPTTTTSAAKLKPTDAKCKLKARVWIWTFG